MSLLGNLFENLTGNGNSTDNSEKPCSNCNPSCEIYPNACSECRPYKEKLTEVLYNVAHLEEFYARYEVASMASGSAGASTCPFCGAPNPSGALACEYCGSQLREGSSKITVNSAAEIPNPIMEAQSIIFDRQALIKKYTSENSNSNSGLLGSLLGALAGSGDSFGERMTEEEIRAVAEEYGVSVESYLAGLDNGVYYTKSVKAAKDRAEAQMQGNYGPAGIGVAGAGMAGAAMYNNNYGRQAYMNQQPMYGRPPQPPMGQPMYGRPPQPVNQQQYGRPQQNMQQQTNNRPAQSQPVQPAKPSKPALNSQPRPAQTQQARPSQPMSNSHSSSSASKAQTANKAQSFAKPTQTASRPAAPARPAQTASRPAPSRPASSSRPAPSRPSGGAGGIKKK